MFVCCECCVLSGRGLCDKPMTRPEESYRLCCVVVWNSESSWMRARQVWKRENMVCRILCQYIMSVHFILLRIREVTAFTLLPCRERLFAAVRTRAFSRTIVMKKAIACFRIRLSKNGPIAVTYANDCALVTLCNQLVSHPMDDQALKWTALPIISSPVRKFDSLCLVTAKAISVSPVHFSAIIARNKADTPNLRHSVALLF